MNKEQKKSWKNWNIEDELDSEYNSKKALLGFRFKFLIFFFIIISTFLLNLEILEVLSLADGKVIPQGRIKYIQHLEGGIVDEILIKEGEKVSLNQPLVVLSKAKASSEYEEINERLKSIELSIYRIDSEKKFEDKITKKDLSQFDKTQIKFENELLKSRKDSLNLEKKLIIKNIKNLEKKK